MVTVSAPLAGSKDPEPHTTHLPRTDFCRPQTAGLASLHQLLPPLFLKSTKEEVELQFSCLESMNAKKKKKIHHASGQQECCKGSSISIPISYHNYLNTTTSEHTQRDLTHNKAHKD